VWFLSEWNVYVLVLLTKDLVHAATAKRGFSVQRGVYLYVGSAKGAGGAIARLARHISRGKKVKWHIDHLTESPLVEVVGSYLVKSKRGLDCESILAHLLASHFPYLEGFGSTDKPRDLSHLFYCGLELASCLEEATKVLEGADCALEVVYALITDPADRSW
jgi:Uri superfamily endonuclease